jgi:hypothetical protein
MFEALKQHAWQLVLLYLVSGIVSLILANKSQIDGWANANPRLAGILKLMRGMGLDPWLVFQSLSLLILKRLPQKPPQDPPAPPNDQSPVGLGGSGGRLEIMPPRVPPGSAAMVALFVLCLVLGCSSSAPPPKPSSSLPPDDPCHLQRIVEFAVKCSADCRLKNPDDPNPCLDGCEKQVDERCGQ